MNSKKESASEMKKYPVIVRFDEDDLPELKKWKVGGKYTLVLNVEQTSMAKGDEYGDTPEGSKNENKHRASFKVLDVSVPGSSPKPSSMIADAMKKRI